MVCREGDDHIQLADEQLRSAWTLLCFARDGTSSQIFMAYGIVRGSIGTQVHADATGGGKKEGLVLMAVSDRAGEVELLKHLFIRSKNTRKKTFFGNLLASIHYFTQFCYKVIIYSLFEVRVNSQMLLLHSFPAPAALKQ